MLLLSLIHVSGLLPAQCGKQAAGFRASRVCQKFQGAGKKELQKNLFPSGLYFVAYTFHQMLANLKWPLGDSVHANPSHACRRTIPVLGIVLSNSLTPGALHSN